MTITPFTEIDIDENLRQQLQHNLSEEGQVILHIMRRGRFVGDAIRIWPTTFLIPKEGGKKSKLVAAEKIGIYPQWLRIPVHKEHCFTLIFSPLPKDCHVFAMLEDIPVPCGFYLGPILRNETDVYVLHL